MGAREVYERLKDGNSKAKKVYAKLQQSKLLEDYDSLFQYNTDFYNQAKTRFYDEDENYVYKYRDDTKDWLSTVESFSSQAKEKSNSIRSFMDEYGMYLDSDFSSKITKCTLRSLASAWLRSVNKYSPLS